jgi:hypothetical protein
VQVGDKAFRIVRGVLGDEPGEVVPIRGYLDWRVVLVHVEQVLDVLLDVAEGLALRCAEAHRASAGRLEVRPGLERQRSSGQRKELIQVCLHRLGATKQRIHEPHACPPVSA